jgi:hypothetical protein
VSCRVSRQLFAWSTGDVRPNSSPPPSRASLVASSISFPRSIEDLRVWRRSKLWFMAIVSVACLGCAGKDTAQVSGRVQYKGGEPIKAGIRVIRFEPAADTTATVRKTASGNIADDGSFTLFTRKPGDGVYLGNYDVTFTILSSATGGENLTRPEYMRAESTPFHATVDGDTANLVFELEPK